MKLAFLCVGSDMGYDPWSKFKKKKKKMVSLAYKYSEDL